MTTNHHTWGAEPPTILTLANERCVALFPGDPPRVVDGMLYDGADLVACRVMRDDEGTWWATLTAPCIASTVCGEQWCDLVKRVRECRADPEYREVTT